ncbi:MAG: hypothetical protein LBD41_06025 [Clostridiales Family XIII bacterium]|jgi:hypothetical protein|nr:hypothetical protein [Clostridiales Family XIII bacterium]
MALENRKTLLNDFTSKKLPIIEEIMRLLYVYFGRFKKIPSKKHFMV